MLIRLNQIMRGWANYFKHAVCKRTLSRPVDTSCGGRVIRWLRRMHRWRWKDVRRRFTTPTGQWTPITVDGIDVVQPGRGAGHPISLPRAIRSPTPGPCTTTPNGRNRGEPGAMETSHAGFGERPGETDREQSRHRAPGRLNVRHEALMIRAEVRDLRRRTCRSRDGEAEGSLTRELPGWVGAALTTPGRVSIARWGGSGKRDEEEYARNQRRLRPSKGKPAQIWRIWAGRGAHLFGFDGAGNFRAGLRMSVWEATVTCCGVAVAMPQGQSWAPPSSSESQ